MKCCNLVTQVEKHKGLLEDLVRTPGAVLATWAINVSSPYTSEWYLRIVSLRKNAGIWQYGILNETLQWCNGQLQYM